MNINNLINTIKNTIKIPVKSTDNNRNETITIPQFCKEELKLECPDLNKMDIKQVYSISLFIDQWQTNLKYSRLVSSTIIDGFLYHQGNSYDESYAIILDKTWTFHDDSIDKLKFLFPDLKIK